MPYHVVLRGRSGTWTDMDLSEEVLRDQISVPYLQTERLLVGQKLFHPNVVEKLSIYFTDNTSVEISSSLEEMRANELRAATFVGSGLVAKTGKDVTEEVLSGAREFIRANPKEHSEAHEARDQVFVVHGRDQTVCDSMFAMLQAMRLKPIWWEDAVNVTEQPSPYIGEILDAAFAKAKAVIVLLTGDDEARLRKRFWSLTEPDERKLLPQARPNVIFEAGMAFARFPKGTLIAAVGTTRRFSDIAGRHYVRLDTDNGPSDLMGRLRTCGCSVDPRPSWIKIGSFDRV